MFIAVDGIDGAGKTTLVHNLQSLLGRSNPLITKEPTADSEWGKALREAASNGRLPRETEIEYFHKDRIEHIANVIKPALDIGRTVITDRYVDSTLAYQCSSPAEADKLYRKFLPEILVPEITFILDCPVEIGLQRVASRNNGKSKFENRDVLKIARAIFESRREPHHVHIDATKSAQDAFTDAAAVLRRRFADYLQNDSSSQTEFREATIGSPNFALAGNN